MTTSNSLALLACFCALGCLVQTRLEGTVNSAHGAHLPAKVVSIPVAVIYNPDKAMIEAALKGQDPFTKFEPGTRGVLTARTTRTVHDARNLPDYVVKLMAMGGSQMVP